MSHRSPEMESPRLYFMAMSPETSHFTFLWVCFFINHMRTGVPTSGAIVDINTGSTPLRKTIKMTWEQAFDGPQVIDNVEHRTRPESVPVNEPLPASGGLRTAHHREAEGRSGRPEARRGGRKRSAKGPGSDCCAGICWAAGKQGGADAGGGGTWFVRAGPSQPAASCCPLKLGNRGCKGKASYVPRSFFPQRLKRCPTTMGALPGVE